jgi:Domain of unknown function (DUF4276)
MRELVFLLEEESAKAFLESLLPRILDSAIETRLIAFEGKQDLEKQLMKKIRGYTNPNARFIVMRDQDSNPDCAAIKADLLQKCKDAGRLQQSLVRIACKELESFYLADLTAVESALFLKENDLAKHQNKAIYRASDNCQNPSKELAKLTKGNYQKVSHSREIGLKVDINNTRSSSFKNLISGIKKSETELLQAACS